MGFFKNKTFNLIYWHVALQAVAMHGGEAFAFVYLLKAGISVPVVLLCIGLMFGSRMIFRSAVVPVAKRFGLRRTLIVSILVEALTYPILAHVSDVGPALIAYLALWAMSSSFYWTTYHSYVAHIGNAEHSGSQYGLVLFVDAIVGIATPLAAGLALAYAGPAITFSVVGLIMACAAIPIALGPEVEVLPHATIPWETRKLAALALFADGIRSGSFHFTWLIALFITLNANFAAFGGTLALAGLVGAIAGLFVGRAVDLGRGKRALLVGVVALGIAILLRAFGYGDVWSAVIANAAAAMAWPAYNTVFLARVTNLARASPCPLRYHVVAEGGWDAGTALSCLISAAAIAAGLSFFWPLLFALAGCALLYAALAPGFAAEKTA